MTIAKNRLMTLEEYLDYDDGTDTAYELVDGILVEMTAEVDINILIASFLFSIFLKFVPYYYIRRGTEIVVAGRYANTRIPDLMVLAEEGVAALPSNKRSMVMFDMPAPALVVEVVSSSDTNKASRGRDYTRKKIEYAQRGIPEYWIIDPAQSVVLVLTLTDEIYQETKFAGDEAVRSPQFPALNLSASQILNAGMAQSKE
ncbi:MAG: hypothetical protein DCF25_06135 [Leptolyngbya foveolarum]|uniref:Putative restriction endonuclease domain-containing protein n=1 Tax=Leptolyngbya foveolarum TaxID=47253 RepID=A0A2W4UJW9_9CYAN|nr:MAG: hypothetical protein DCF25_06135 [Leptolyngbya foveolarum]